MNTEINVNNTNEYLEYISEAATKVTGIKTKVFLVISIAQADKNSEMFPRGQVYAHLAPNLDVPQFLELYDILKKLLIKGMNIEIPDESYLRLRKKPVVEISKTDNKKP